MGPIHIDYPVTHLLVIESPQSFLFNNANGVDGRSGNFLDHVFNIVDSSLEWKNLVQNNWQSDLVKSGNVHGPKKKKLFKK